MLRIARFFARTFRPVPAEIGGFLHGDFDGLSCFGGFTVHLSISLRTNELFPANRQKKSFLAITYFHL
jgi:hypothetical protein